MLLCLLLSAVRLEYNRNHGVGTRNIHYLWVLSPDGVGHTAQYPLDPGERGHSGYGDFSWSQRKNGGPPRLVVPFIFGLKDSSNLVISPFT